MTAQSTVYFGFGSNLWREQMRRRCPQSIFLGVGRLPHWCWFINERGYANVKRSVEKRECVYGLIYALTPWDETALDGNEGVPEIYEKELHGVEFWDVEGDAPANMQRPGKQQTMLVYVDNKCVTEGDPQPEYVYRMNKGIDDALAVGIPRIYIDNVLRKSIPDVDITNDQLVQKAQSQACHFRYPGT